MLLIAPGHYFVSSRFTSRNSTTGHSQFENAVDLLDFQSFVHYWLTEAGFTLKSHIRCTLGEHSWSTIVSNDDFFAIIAVATFASV